MALRLLLVSSVLLLTALAGCSDDEGGDEHTGHSGVTHDVRVSDFAFTPGSLAVKVGDTVKWTVSGGSHTVDGTGGIDSQTLGVGQSYSHAFHEAGTFTYKCNFHSQMTGTVRVAA
jgi:plastocyanin